MVDKIKSVAARNWSPVAFSTITSLAAVAAVLWGIVEPKAEKFVDGRIKAAKPASQSDLMRLSNDVEKLSSALKVQARAQTATSEALAVSNARISEKLESTNKNLDRILDKLTMPGPRR